MEKTIMVVDDESDDLGTIKDALEKEGHMVKAVTNGAEALDLLAEFKFDLILIDIKMPALSGYDLLELFRDRLGNEVKMVFVSIVPEEEANLEGADGFIQKPFMPKELAAQVKAFL